MPSNDEPKKRGRPPALLLPLGPITSDPLPKSAFARLIGCLPPRITELVKRGIIRAVTPDGWIIPTEAVAEMRAAGCFADGSGEQRSAARHTATVPREVARMRLILEAAVATMAKEALRRLPPTEARALVSSADGGTRTAAIAALDRDLGAPAGYASWAEHPFFDRPSITDAQWSEIAAEAGPEPRPTPREVAADMLMAMGPTMSRAEAERVQANYKALVSQIEYAERVKQVLPLQQIEDVVGLVLTTVRTSVLALPSRAAPLLVGKSSPRDVFAVLTELVTDALTELSEFNFDEELGVADG